jgi:hypothetical protein
MTQAKTKHGLPRHVLAKHLKGGDVAYYWNPPPWGRDFPGAPKATALRSDLTRATQAAATLNAKLDRAARGHRSHSMRRQLRIVPNGFLSSVDENRA